MAETSALRVKDFLQKLFTSISQEGLTEIKHHLKDILKTQPLKNISNNDGTVEGQMNLKGILNECKDAKKKTCVHFAAARGNAVIFNYLVKKGGNVELKDDQGNNAFLIAVQHGHMDIVKTLVEDLKTDVFIARDTAVGATHLAAGNGDIPMLEYLVGKGCKLGKKTESGTEVDWAVGNCKHQMLDYLLGKGIKSEGPVANSIMACGLGSLEVLKTIIKHNADAINDQDGDKWSLLQVAAEVGANDIVEYLIEKGVDVNYENQGKTALDLAWENDKWPCVEVLRPLSSKTISGAKKTSVSNEGQQEERVDPEELAKKKEAGGVIKAQGNELFGKGEHQAACEKYTEAITVYNKEPSYFTNRAACLIKLGKYQEAINDCQAAKKLDSNWVKSYFREGEAYFALKEYGESAASYWEGLKLEPNNKSLKYGFENSVKIGKEHHQKMQKK